MKFLRNLFLFVAIGLMAIFSLFAQEYNVLPINTKTQKIEYSSIVKIDSTLTKEILYTRTKEWIAITFNSAQSVIQMDDKEAGVIILKGNFNIYNNTSFINFTLNIQLKDGKYKYTFSDFNHETIPKNYSGGALENSKPMCGFFMMAKREWIEIIPFKTNERVNFIINDLFEYLSAPINIW